MGDPILHSAGGQNSTTVPVADVVFIHGTAWVAMPTAHGDMSILGGQTGLQRMLSTSRFGH
jgi:hypothetical protein